MIMVMVWAAVSGDTDYTETLGTDRNGTGVSDYFWNTSADGYDAFPKEGRSASAADFSDLLLLQNNMSNLIDCNTDVKSINGSSHVETKNGSRLCVIAGKSGIEAAKRIEFAETTPKPKQFKLRIRRPKHHRQMREGKGMKKANNKSEKEISTVKYPTGNELKTIQSAPGKILEQTRSPRFERSSVQYQDEGKKSVTKISLSWENIPSSTSNFAHQLFHRKNPLLMRIERTPGETEIPILTPPTTEQVITVETITEQTTTFIPTTEDIPPNILPSNEPKKISTIVHPEVSNSTCDRFKIFHSHIRCYACFIDPTHILTVYFSSEFVFSCGAGARSPAWEC